MTLHTVKRPLRILGTGIYLPGNGPISSETLEQQHQIPAGWAKRYSGVEERYWVNGETGTDMAVAALQNALNKAGLEYHDLDLVVNASAAYDHPIPHNACLMQERLGSSSHKPVPGFDIDATCLSSIVAFDVCAQLLDGKRYRRIAIVSSEVSSLSLNSADWETFTLLGDAAVAIIIGYPDQVTDDGPGLIHADMATWPHAARYNIVPAGGNAAPGKTYPADITQFYFNMEGIKLLRLAMEKLPEFSEKFFREAECTMPEIQHVFAHQASLAGLMTAMKILGITPEQMPINLPRYGNTLACSTGLVLHEAFESGRIQSGDLGLMMGTGAGFSIGGVLLRF
jgi:3-oxoacyl-[acyl-carrier-protein] synthase III